jgi:hypothetical protein
MADAALLGPGDEIAEPVDDAAAVAPVGRADLPVAVVVEGAPADAQHFGCLVDGEKGVVIIIEHAEVLQGLDVTNLGDMCSVGEVQSAGPSDCTRR